MVTITDEELLEKARVLFAKLGGMKSQDARLVRALIERAGLDSQPTKRAGDLATPCPACGVPMTSEHCQNCDFDVKPSA
jgi:hypothetical protein